MTGWTGWLCMLGAGSGGATPPSVELGIKEPKAASTGLPWLATTPCASLPPFPLSWDVATHFRVSLKSFLKQPTPACQSSEGCYSVTL